MAASAGSTDAAGHGKGGPAPHKIVVAFGFWLFLLSDIIMFSAFFATYAVLSGRTNGGPDGHALFHLDRVIAETACLLLSSFTCGLLSIGFEQKKKGMTYLFAAATFGLGVAFMALELNEFAGMISDGNGPDRSAFLSAFFTLVGTHGVHVTGGLIWLAVMMAQVASLGFTSKVQNRLMCFSLFWHALDIVWVGVFTIVYLAGSRT